MVAGPMVLCFLLAGVSAAPAGAALAAVHMWLRERCRLEHHLSNSDVFCAALLEGLQPRRSNRTASDPPTPAFAGFLQRGLWRASLRIPRAPQTAAAVSSCSRLLPSTLWAVAFPVPVASPSRATTRVSLSLSLSLPLSPRAHPSSLEQVILLLRCSYWCRLVKLV